MLLKQPVKWCLLLLLLLSAYNSQAQTGIILKSVLDGSQNQLVPNAEITVQDTAYFSPTRQNSLELPYPIKNIVTLRINEYSNRYLPVKFTATANVRITYMLPDQSTSSIDRSLVIDYDTAGHYAARSNFVFDGAHRVVVKLLDISSDAGTDVLTSLMIDNELQAQPVYVLSCTADAVQRINVDANTPNTDSTDEVGVSWPVIAGADEYDLEWTFIDSSALSRYGNPVQSLLLFRNNASRVTVKDNAYRIPLFYDNGGVLYFRVRAVQRRSDDRRIETAWSSDYTDGLGHFNFCGHQRNLNWQSSLSFAEDGKRKAVVQYFDGSLRSRQTVTKDNSTNTALVAESYYDYQGRPVIQVLPSPTLSSVIKYGHNFNQALNNAEYDKNNYDSIPGPEAFLTASAQPMSDGSGANQYYSSKNPEKDNGFNRFIPDAQGYAFTETSYAQDNTGRISRQSGVGPVYKLGSNHETKYYYGSASQKELDMLFGTEAGNEKHYFKNMVRDANGQFSVSYLDMHGRTIATALAGEPDSASMASLPTNVPFIATDTLSGPGRNHVTDLTMEIHKSQLVAVDDTCTFSYTLVPPVLQKTGCTGTYCYKGLYDLEITITDDSYNQLLGGQPVVVKVPVPAIITADCDSLPAPITVSFSKFLPKGSYEFTKRLTINREALEYYRDNPFLDNNMCKTLEDFVEEQRALLQDKQCEPDCKSCMDSLGTWDSFRDKYMTRAGITIDTASYRGDALAAWQQALDGCNVLCNTQSETETIRKAMLLDMTAPSGQYADPTDGSRYSIYYQGSPSATPIYRMNEIVYRDESGKPDSVYSPSTFTYVRPQDLTPEQFAEAFKESWAEALLPYHPEYCKFLEYQRHDASSQWDVDFQATDTYADAKEKGYLNPTGGVGGAFVYFTPNAANQDPLSKESADTKSRLESKLTNYVDKTDANHPLPYSMWSAATISVKCGENNTPCAATYQQPSEAFNESKLCAGDLDMAWRSFRQLYLQAKRDLIDGLVQNVVCAGGVRSPSAKTLLDAGKQPNFNNAMDALSQNGLGQLTNLNMSNDQAKALGQQQLDQYYEDNCTAYAKMWIQQLAPCKYTQQDLDVLLPKLIAVCKEGADQDHPMGASTVKPGSTSSDRSFQQVLKAFNQAKGITNPLECNEELLTAPKPYDRQPAYGSKTTYTKPADCECEKLNALYNEFLLMKTMADGNFSAYIKRTRGVQILESNLEKLLNACNATAAGCTYLAEPLQIPGLMQCYTATACATCRVVDSLYTAYQTTYPNDTPHITEPDSIQRKKNELFANFMNNRLGFSKSAWEYLAFRDSCKNVNSQDTIVCRTIRQLIKTYSSGSTDMLYDVQRTADNGYLMAGYTNTVIFSLTAGTNAAASTNRDAYIIKTDSKGNFQWAKSYGGANDDEFDRLKPTADGGYIAIGTTKSFIHPLGDVFVVKMNANGNVIWSKAIGFATGSGEKGNDIVELNNGGFAFAGGYNYVANGADWVIGTLTSDGNLGWVKQMGSPSSDPLISLLADNDTIVVSASVNLGTYYDGVMLKINKNTGERYDAGKRYDINSKSNWFGSIFKTTAGYKISVLNTKDYNSGEGQGVILDLKSNGDIISSKAFTPPSGNISWLPIALTADGGVIAAQEWINTPSDVYLHKLDAANSLAWSSRPMVSGNEGVHQIIQNPDGTYAAVGMHNNQAMLMLPTVTGRTGCQDSAITTAYTNIGANVVGDFIPQIESLLPNPSIDITITQQDRFPTELGIACSGTDTCFKVSNGPLLCGNAAEIFPTVLLDDINNCSDNDFFAISTGTILYNAYRDSLLGTFEQDYINSCLQAQDREKFTIKYRSSEYHYTLYYYDQAGNLIKTIPPAGVVIDRTDNWFNSVETARQAGTSVTPAHTLPTNYRYNTLNLVVAQQTPDAGISHFWYDRLGRLAVSQNAKQKAVNAYSYTSYDELGRITEVGEISSTAPMTDAISRKADALTSWMATAAGSKKQITTTVYDVAHPTLEGVAWNATNLRNRVSWTGVYNTAADLAAGTSRSAATFYSYDILGNVKELLQDYNSQQSNNVANRFKKIKYDYDLVSGKVNMVSYQQGEKDAFYHRYSYDAENRLTNVETSADSVYWENDAFYQYYKHGPLARAVLGQQQVQGLDYAYTLQGWLKGVNSSAATSGFDMGNDGANGSITARDAFGYALHYYGQRDYQPVNATVRPFAGTESADFKPLFNGNIAAMSVNLPKAGEPLLYSYGYDVLNRLSTMGTTRGLNTTTNSWTPQSLRDFAEAVTYDANGNILTYKRNGNQTWASKDTAMDKLTYNYITGTNKLDAIHDTVDKNFYDTDIDDQGAGNYAYDSIGNLTQDIAAGIGKDSIQWTVYGKIKSIKKRDGTNINYTYDATGNRLSKNVDGRETRYIRDATGNILSVYVAGDPAINNGALSQTEVDLYGSSRLGMSTRTTAVQDMTPDPGVPLFGMGSGTNINFNRGSKLFELSNHLGNVLATVMDTKEAVSDDGSLVDHYNAHVVSVQDYYPFGMVQPGRSWNIGEYRYGFNGKENDNEVKGEGNELDFGARIYDPRTARWLALDPLQKKYPNETPYSFTSDNPILYQDSDGRDKIITFYLKTNKGTYPVLRVVDKNYFEVHLHEGAFGGVWFTKNDIKTDYLIDVSSGSKMPISFTTSESFSSEIGFGEYLSRKTGAYGIMNKLQKGEVQPFGYVLTGNESGDAFDLVSDAGVKEHVDLGGVLGMAGNWRDLAVKDGIGHAMDLLEALATESGPLGKAAALLLKRTAFMDDVTDAASGMKDAGSLVLEVGEEDEPSENPDTNISIMDKKGWWSEKTVPKKDVPKIRSQEKATLNKTKKK